MSAARGGADGPDRPLRVLFVSPYVPSQVRIRPYYWVRQLAARGHAVSLFAIGGPDDGPAVEEMRRLCHDVSIFPMPRWRPLVNCAVAALGREPLQRAWSRLPALSAALREAVAVRTFDVAHIEHLRGSCFAADLAPLPVVYDAVDSISLLFEQTRTHGPTLRHRFLATLDADRTARFEAGVLEAFRVVLVSSPVDAGRFRALAGDRPEADRRLIVLPTPVDPDRFTPVAGPRDRATIVFAGKMSYHANIAAAQALVRGVMPRVWQAIPHARVVIVGQGPDRSIRRLAVDARVTVTGWVPDVAPYLATATLAVCPLRYGVGVQSKVLEAMAAGVPVAVTREATAGMHAEPGRDLVVVDSLEACAGATIHLLDAPEARAELAKHGREYVERNHNPAALGRQLESAYRHAIGDPSAA